MTEDDKRFIAQLKNFVICGWIGLIYGIAAVVVADVRWSVIVLIVLLAGGSSYIGVGRKWLERVAILILFVTMLSLAGALPSGGELRAFVHHTGAWLRGSAS